MTRVLSELLSAAEPSFRQSMHQLERLSGQSNMDILLSVEVQQNMRRKLTELGLDPHNTEGPELYAALGERLKNDELLLLQRLGQDAPHTDIVSTVAAALQTMYAETTCYALKPAVARRLLKQQSPKRTMKALGYRSFDSMMKHEPIACLYAAAWMTESPLWAKRVISAYTKLTASDFEMRRVNIERPTGSRWETFSATIIHRHKQHVIHFKELGSVVLLPLVPVQPPLAALSTMVLAMYAINDIKCATSYLKLQQVHAAFGNAIKQVVLDDTTIGARVLDQTVAWPVIQRFYSRVHPSIRGHLFEPVIQAEDFSWQHVETSLAELVPELDFWRGTAHLGMLDGRHPVSCNLLDAIVSHCNGLQYGQRLTHYFKQALHTEILLRYLSHDRLSQVITDELQHKYAAEFAAA